jgi:hypothetical protein
MVLARPLGQGSLQLIWIGRQQDARRRASNSDVILALAANGTGASLMARENTSA